MWNLISHFLTFAGGMASGVMLMCLMQTGKLADKEFETMKNGVTIVNTARASLIDYDALLQYLDSGKIFAAGLDVHVNEPEYDLRFAKYDNVILTPHNAAITKEATDRASMMAVDNILDYFQKGDVE